MKAKWEYGYEDYRCEGDTMDRSLDASGWDTDAAEQYLLSRGWA